MRIRSIKPEFWRSDDIDRLDWPTRLLFIGLWSYVDDNGVGRDRESDIAADLFSGDLSRDPRETLATVSGGLQKLSEGGQIIRYTVDGKSYLHITAWEKHQRIDKPAKGRYPLPTCDDATPRDTFATPSRDPRETVAPGTEEQGNRGTDLSSDESDEPDLFADFYAAYPRHEGRRAAEKAWRAAIKRADPSAIMAGLERFQFSDDRKFTPLPASWLNADRWADEQTDNVRPIRPDDPHAGKVKWAELSPGQWQECHADGFYMGCKTQWLPAGQRPA